MPPELRNHQFPTGAKTPAFTAASSLDKPAATSRQNRHRFSRCHTGGRPAEDNFSRVDRADFRLPVAIHTSKFGALPRPVESAQYVSIRYSERLAEAASSLLSEALATVTTTLWPKRSMVFTRPRSSIDGDRGATSKPWSSPCSNGSIGSTTAVFWNQSGISRLQRQKNNTTPCWTHQLWPHNLDQMVSGKAWAVHFRSR
jgi:hypothetical protein